MPLLRLLPPTAAPVTFSDVVSGVQARPADLDRFRLALESYLGTSRCYLAASGRTALFLLLRELLRQSPPGRREVTLPAYTCPAIAKVALDLDLTLRLVDISPETLAVADDALAEAVSERTLAVIHVHPFGIPQPVARVAALAHSAGAVLIEDAAQSLGARLPPGDLPAALGACQPALGGGPAAGSVGDFGLFSLGPGKPLSLGGGGVLSVNDPRWLDTAERAWRGIRTPGPMASALAVARLGLTALAFHPTGWRLAAWAGLHRVGDAEASWGYRVAGLPPAQAGSGLVELPRLEASNARRRATATRLIAGLARSRLGRVPVAAGGTEPIYLRLPVVASSEAVRDELHGRLWKAGVSAGRMYRRAIGEVFQQAGTKPCPGAETVARRLLTLPTHHYVSDEDVDRIVRVFAQMGGIEFW